ncbi:uncharacterized protein LOC143617794 [Bidens hawaiensis]|uniref:uncharacterized protein LOC143617794 n=1 Tax=Bidens hawaiensis TaxID=980011 RepID=UPI004049E807
MEEEEDQIDWDTLFDFDPTPIDSNSNNNDQSPLSVDDIEQFLLNDDDENDPTGDFCQGFVNEILLDSPLENVDKSGEVVDGSDSAEEVKQINNNNSDVDDPLDKKRKRQLRNKDAALRSRERKKMHVKDLEMKSKYYEAECRRLGSLLQWYMAENQALRFSLHSGSSSSSNASMTRQESAVLLLESLLLGSLLWLMAAVVVLPGLLLLALHEQSQSQLETVVEGKHLPNLALRKGVSRSISVGKQFKASRSRMRRFLQNVLPVF